MAKYRVLNNLGEGSYAKVFKCEKLSDGSIWACKKLIQCYNNLNDVPAVPEIQILRQLNKHSNIIELHEIIYNKRIGSVCLIFELMDMNLYEYIKDRKSPLSTNVICNCIYSILVAIEYIHKHGFIHRDVKPENILIKGERIKLADFGMCRSISNQRPNTDYVATRWYRAPECILTKGDYGQPMDIWSVGCVMFEIITGKVLFNGSNDLDQINKIHAVFGTPSMKTLKKFEQHKNPAINLNFLIQRGIGFIQHLTICSVDTIDLLIQMCAYDADNRILAVDALAHPYFALVRDRNLETMSEDNIPLIEIDDDELITKRLSPIEEDSLLPILPEVKRYSSVESLWEKLLISLSLCSNLIDRLLTTIHRIGLCQRMNYVSTQLIANQTRETVLLAHTNMAKIQTNLELILNHVKTALKILIMAPTWQLTNQLLPKVLHNLKRVGKDCIILINEIKDKCVDVKKRINESTSTIMDRLVVETISATQFSERRLARGVSLSVWDVIGVMIKIAKTVVLDGMMNSPITDMPIEENLTHGNHPINSHYIERNDQIKEVVDYSMLIELQWDNLILLFSLILSRLSFALNERMDTLIEQIPLQVCSSMTITEQVFIIELVKAELSQIYEETCALLINVRIYLDVSDKFLIEKLDHFLLMQSHENNTKDNTLIRDWSMQTNSTRMAVTQLIQECQKRYNMIFQQQQVVFSKYLKELNNTV